MPVLVSDAALFPPRKKTPHFLNPESQFLSATTHLLMPMLSFPSACPSLDLFVALPLNAGLSPCSHTTTTTELSWILTPGRVFKDKKNKQKTTTKRKSNKEINNRE